MSISQIMSGSRRGRSGVEPPGQAYTSVRFRKMWTRCHVIAKSRDEGRAHLEACVGSSSTVRADAQLFPRLPRRPEPCGRAAGKGATGTRRQPQERDPPRHDARRSGNEPEAPPPGRQPTTPQAHPTRPRPRPRAERPTRAPAARPTKAGDASGASRTAAQEPARPEGERRSLGEAHSGPARNLPPASAKESWGLDRHSLQRSSEVPVNSRPSPQYGGKRSHPPRSKRPQASAPPAGTPQRRHSAPQVPARPATTGGSRGGPKAGHKSCTALCIASPSTQWSGRRRRCTTRAAAKRCFRRHFQRRRPRTPSRACLSTATSTSAMHCAHASRAPLGAPRGPAVAPGALRPPRPPTRQPHPTRETALPAPRPPPI